MPAAKRLDGVDLRVGVPDVEVPGVVSAFGLGTREASECAIHLLGNPSCAPAQRAMARATARLERAPGRREVVVQLRRARHAQLGSGWSDFHSDAEHRLRIAEEWSGTQRILAAALTASLEAGDPAAVPASAPVAVRAGRGLLSARQRDFLKDCAGMEVLEDQLTLLGPIRERAWTLESDDLRFRVRRWTARLAGSTSALDLVDLEAQASAADAPFLFPALRALARRCQIDTEAEADPMTIRAVIWASAHKF